MADEQLQKYDGIWTGEVTWDTVNFYKDYAGTLSNNESRFPFWPWPKLGGGRLLLPAHFKIQSTLQ